MQVAFSPDASKLATCGGDRLVNIFTVLYVGTSPRSRQLHGKVCLPRPSALPFLPCAARNPIGTLVPLEDIAWSLWFRVKALGFRLPACATRGMACGHVQHLVTKRTRESEVSQKATLTWSRGECVEL